MRRTDWGPLLVETCRIATAYLEGLPERAVTPASDAHAISRTFAGPVPDEPCDPRQVVAELARGAEPGITAMSSGRFYGWVIGGGVPAAIAADWLTTVWDQNAGSAEGTPSAAVLEQVALRWVAELLDVPATSGILVTGAQMASFTGLAVARSEVLRRAGWDVEADGLAGAPPLRVIVGAERHGTIDKALRLLGIGSRQLTVVAADGEGRMRADALAAALAGEVPTILCVQAGNVNGGAFDPMREIAGLVAAVRAPIWVHVDGAFGLWARVAPARRALADGFDLADSWATDAHKWLNTPYDCGIALTRHGEAQRRVMRGSAAYLPEAHASGVFNAFDHGPELSRRARGFALWATLRELGRRGVSELVERTCVHAARLAAGLTAMPGVEVMNEVALNQLVVRFGDDARTRDVLARLLAGGVCYPSGTTWRGVFAIRFSISNWATDEDDIERTLQAIAGVCATLP